MKGSNLFVIENIFITQRRYNRMVKIKLKRLGYKKNPFYRIVVINATTKREGAPIQQLGHYNPKTKELKLDKVSASEWIKKGAQPTQTVKYLINNSDENGNLNYKPSEKVKLSKKAIAKAAAEKEAAEKAAAEAANNEEAAQPEEA